MRGVQTLQSLADRVSELDRAMASPEIRKCQICMHRSVVRAYSWSAGRWYPWWSVCRPGSAHQWPPGLVEEEPAQIYDHVVLMPVNVQSYQMSCLFNSSEQGTSFYLQFGQWQNQQLKGLILASDIHTQLSTQLQTYENSSVWRLTANDQIDKMLLKITG